MVGPTMAAVCIMNDLLCVGREGASCVKIYFTHTLQMNIDGIFSHTHTYIETAPRSSNYLRRIYVVFFLYKCISCSNSRQVHRAYSIDASNNNEKYSMHALAFALTLKIPVLRTNAINIRFFFFLLIVPGLIIQARTCAQISFSQH